MRLHSFILENMEVILQKWEDLARDIWPVNNPSTRELRDHAEEMLLAIITDMQTIQSSTQQHDKSVGKGWPSTSSDSVDSSSARHAANRVHSGFDIRNLLVEYRALRASVLHLWGQTVPDMSAMQIEDMTRFNECVDQLLSESVLFYTASVEKSRELLLGILGHDLRSPLCVVSMMAGLLQENKEVSEPARHMASQIVIAAREMTRLVVDLLDFAGSHLGAKMHVTRESMCLEGLCREVMEEIAVANPSRFFEFETDGDGNGEWDRTRLRQLISNLLINAVQHGASQTPIRMFMKAGQDEVVLGVCNQGQPIPPAMQSVMFDPLRRCSCDCLSKDAGSLGLGLYIAREVTSAHGGVIEVKSGDRETTFLVKLPRWDQFSSPKKPANMADARGTSWDPGETSAHASFSTFD
jgi:signal transduction histidine kinase